MSQYTLWGKKVFVDIPPEVFPTDEELKEREDLFPGCQHGWFTSPSSGAQLHYRIWLPPSQKKKQSAKGVLVFHHGIQGQSGRGFVLKDGRKVAIANLADRIVAAGYAFYAIDALGHGFSEGKRFYIERWEDNRSDFEQFARMVAQKHPDLPLFLMGESYGGCLTLHVAALWENDDNDAAPPKNYRAIVLMAPAIIGDLPPAPLVFTLRRFLAPLFPSKLLVVCEQDEKKNLTDFLYYLL